MASCVQNIRTKNDQNLIIGFQVSVIKTQCILVFKASSFG